MRMERFTTKSREALAASQSEAVRRGNPEAVVVEDGASFAVHLSEGQKTGWFFDQADNRSRFSQLYRDARVLDLYSYVGGWGVRAALRGAQRVVCVDSSAAAVAASSGHIKV